jgi:hypothetical protein
MPSALFEWLCLGKNSKTSKSFANFVKNIRPGVQRRADCIVYARIQKTDLYEKCAFQASFDT